MNIIFKIIKKYWQTSVFILCTLLAILISALCRNQFLSSQSQIPIEDDSNMIEAFVLEEENEFFDENAYEYSLEELNNLIYNELSIQEQAHKIAEAAREIGWPEHSPAISDAKIMWHNAEIKIQFYSPIYNLKYEENDQKLWDKRKEEYPIATEIWLFLQEQGYNDYVCAGIVGNMMAEAGGQTLNIQPIIYNSSENYYGICQWSKKYYPSVQGTDLKTQLEFLISNIEYEINTYGRLYKSNFKFHNFLNLTNEKDVALAFAKSYERCNSKYYNVRQDNATKALAYFTS